MTVGRDGEARGEFETEHERPFLCRTSEQGRGLGAGRQGRRRRTPLDGVGGHDRVMRVGRLRGRGGAKECGDAERQGGQTDEFG